MDLGSGGGFDAFLAAQEIGESGRVIGVDMTPAMVSKARANAEQAQFGKGIGRTLVSGCMEKAKELGLKKVFTLTLEPDFFTKMGFVRVQKDALPMKVWSDCAECPKQDHCDEIALECTL